MSSFNCEMLRIAREERGLSQKDLARKLHASQSDISKFEGGEKMPGEDFIQKAASFFGYTVEFFFRPFVALPSGLVFHRKRSALSATERKRIVAEARVRMLDLAIFAEFSGIQSGALPLRDGRSPEDMARHIRILWAVPSGPIANLTKLLEKNKIAVLPFDFGSTFVDGFFMPPAEEGSLQCIVMNANPAMPPDRRRFTIAHELGHLILHRNEFAEETGKRQENEANLFASEFLMPAADIEEDLSAPLTFARLRELKSKWKVSMSALVIRAQQLKKISDSEAKRIWFLFSRYGYRKNEPVMGLSEERPFGVTWLVREFAKAKGTTAPASLFLTPELFARRYPDSAGLAGRDRQEECTREE
ncbi:MAG: ImmA/IrrE family metallo-endopeptidase [Kiritimatiellae bacterium]|nr:ImmA/IrrE family metallo-endopeptidase [Kiritimatiellia bacterium]